jgi:hypothetical protein
LGPTKTIELRGGVADGRRMDVPADSTGLQLPSHPDEGLSIYQRTNERTEDGVEIWLPLAAWGTTS